MIGNLRKIFLPVSILCGFSNPAEHFFIPHSKIS